MSSNQLSYNLLPADKFANTNFRHLFLALSFLEALLTSGNATLCLLLSIYIYTRQPFILLHTSFHPFIQASIFLTASVAQYIKLLTLLFCTIKIILDDGEIFTACAKVEIQPALEMIQVDKSPNEVARRCFSNRQRQVKFLLGVVRLYPLIQLLCGSLSLAFWCTSDERHTVTPVYYQLLQRTQGPSNVIFVCYLTTWCIDLILTPLFCLITTWHYARVDWQIQLLAAQETMEYNLNYPGQLRREHRQMEGGITVCRKASIGRQKRRAKVTKKQRIKAALSPFSPSKLAKLYNEQGRDEEDGEKGKGMHDVHTTQTPLSVPVSPSTSSSSEQDKQEKSSYLTSRDDHSFVPSAGTTPRPHDGSPRYHVGQRLMRMTASISSRRASLDPSFIARSQTGPTSSEQTPERKSTISAYLNVEGADEVADMACDSAWRKQDDIDCFRICIEADETGRSIKS